MSYTKVQIDLKAIRHNIRQLKIFVERNTVTLRDGKVAQRYFGLLPVIKADAYGHGSVNLAKILEAEVTDYLVVSDIEEAKLLRKYGIRSRILVFEPCLPDRMDAIVSLGLIPSISDLSFAKKLNDMVSGLDEKWPIQVNVDTGMSRLGVRFDEVDDFLNEIFKLDHLSLEGIYTHFPKADSDPVFAQNQIDQMENLIRRLDEQGKIIPLVHAANSSGILGYQTHIFNVFRPGLMLYGICPDENLRQDLNLKPAMSVVSKVLQIKKLPAGQGVSYNHDFVTTKETLAAIVPIGYQDGYPVSLSGQAHVLIQNQKCPVLGRVTMDQSVVDVSGLKKVEVGEDVCLLGQQGEETISVDDLSEWSGLISYEILCGFGNRLEREFLS